MTYPAGLKIQLNVKKNLKGPVLVRQDRSVKYCWSGPVRKDLNQAGPFYHYSDASDASEFSVDSDQTNKTSDDPRGFHATEAGVNCKYPAYS